MEAQVSHYPKNRCKNLPYRWTRPIFSSLRNRPQHQCLNNWQALHQPAKKPQLNPSKSTAKLPRRSIQPIARLRAHLTLLNRSLMKPALTCSCDIRTLSNKHVLLHGPNQTSARTLLLAELNGRTTWQFITNTNVPTNTFLKFMATTGMRYAIQSQTTTTQGMQYKILGKLKIISKGDRCVEKVFLFLFGRGI